MMDEDDEYLYGSSAPTGEPTKQQRTPSGSPPVVTPVPQSATFDNISSTNGVVALLETEAENVDSIVPGLSDAVHAASVAVAAAQAQALVQAQEEEEEEEEQVELGEESDEDDIEFIMEPQNRSLDFRAQNARSKTATGPAPLTLPNKAAQPQGPTLTTEYTPMPRGGVPSAPQPPPPSTTAIQAPPQVALTQHVSPLAEESAERQQQQVQQDDVDTSNLPPATAPPSHPTIDPTTPGMLDGRSILEVDIANMTEKPWRRPGSDISDWFNYGFDELTWEAYCYRRRELGEMANVLKANLINFTGMPEDQLSNLPPEVRQMVMTGMTALMNAGGPGPGMMGPSMMMDMSNMLGPMGMGMGMNGDMTMGNAMMQMQESAQQGVNVGVGATSTPEQVGSAVGMMQDGFSGAPGPTSMMNMGMGGDFAMQDHNAMNQQMYQNIDNSATVTAPTPGPGPAIRGGTPVAPVSYRGRGIGAPTMPRGRGFPVRGRVPAVPRPASPLPPNVPTGPRNQNKYKDRDGNAPAVDGLDYGGGGGGSGREGGRTPSGEPEERSSSRKRRSSPGVEDLRGPKRR